MNGPSEPARLPDWAIEYVRASLRLGLSVPEMEKSLIARGLTPTAAAGLVTSVLEERVRGQIRPREAGEREDSLHRILSAVVACGCLLLGYLFGGGLSASLTALWILGPLACIWFPAYLTSRTPEGFIRWGGWVVLLLIGGYRIVLLSLAS
jgi:hypothetical protein